MQPEDLGLDHFKWVNDTLGHPAGDEVLRQVTSVLRAQLRPDDVLARLGGDEFAILMSATSVEAAVGIAERLRQAVAESTFELEGRTFNVSLSIGVGAVDGSLDARAAAAMADVALYAGKEAGRNRVMVTQSESGSLAAQLGG